MSQILYKQKILTEAMMELQEAKKLLQYAQPMLCAVKFRMIWLIMTTEQQ